MRIVLGLGNPGRRYAHTRHNMGFRVVDALARELGARLRLGPVEDLAEVAPATLGDEEIVIAKPQTWMNRSGIAALRLTAFYGSAPSDVIAVYDDVALPLGSVRVRPSGRSAGQKGMESIIQALGTPEIPRVRLGILGDRQDQDLADYVLEPFLPSEMDAVESMIARGAEAVRCLIREGVQKTMSVYNRTEPAPG